jgi:RNA polymerase sigma factor (sigma-70 family)
MRSGPRRSSNPASESRAGASESRAETRRSLPGARESGVTQAERDALVLQNIPIARKIARAVWRKLTHAGQGGYTSPIDIEDVEGWAMVGLVQAAKRYQAGRGVFTHFACRRIRGAAIDAYKRRAYAEMLHVSADSMLADCAIDDSNGTRDLVLLIHTDPSPLPDELAARAERDRALDRAIATLPGDERRALRRSLAGERVVSIGARRGKSATWARGKLTSARQKVAEAMLPRAA